MNKVTENMKQAMRELREKGLTFAAIGKILVLSSNTVQYHLNPETRKKSIERAMKSKTVWKGKKEYLKGYMNKRYNNDSEFREKVKKANRENQRKRREKHGKSNNIS